MMRYGEILIEFREAAALIRLNCPDVCNALNNALMNDFFEALVALEADDAIPTGSVIAVNICTIYAILNTYGQSLLRGTP